jgi:3-isopropylmalate/(R)-2-methylmalate dehydratase large subunit
MGDHEMLRRLQRGEGVPLAEFCRGYDPITRLVVREGGLFAFAKALDRGEIELPRPATGPRPMTMAEKLLARHLVGVPEGEPRFVAPGDAVVVEVDGGYSHEFTTAQVHYFLEQEYGRDYEIENPGRFAVFEDHLIYADEVPKMRAFTGKIDTLRDLQRDFQRHTATRDFSARDRVSPGICHEVAREYLVEPGDFIQATDSHTCMGGVNNALTWGVGATEYANLIHSGFTQVEVPESIRFELAGALPEGVTAKDLMLHVLLEYARPQLTLNRVMEFTGPHFQLPTTAQEILFAHHQAKHNTVWNEIQDYTHSELEEEALFQKNPHLKEKEKQKKVPSRRECRFRKEMQASLAISG